MIDYKKTTWKKRIGDYDGVITEVIVEPNNYYEAQKAKSDNAMPETLTIVFQCTDFVSGDTFEHKQRFVIPLTGGQGLFQQLLDAADFVPDEDDGTFDEQKLVGLELTVNIGERVDRNDSTKTYSDVKKVTKKPSKKPAKSAKPTTSNADNVAVPSDLPF